MRDKKKICGVYSITNLKNNKRYIGSSKNIESRWADHKRRLKRNVHHSIHLQRAWNEYGEQNFCFEILEECLKEQLFEKEQWWYDFYDSGNLLKGYNMIPVAVAGSLCATEEGLKQGKYSITHKQFQEIVDLLVNTNISLKEIAQKLQISYNVISSIYARNCYNNLTKDKTFQKRAHFHSVLKEKEVKDIINRLKTNEYCTDIAKDYNVSYATIIDIHARRTWKELSKEEQFTDISKRSRQITKSVIQYTKTGEILNCFESARIASQVTGVHWKKISACCLGKSKTSGGYVWRFAKDDFNKYETTNNSQIQIDQYSLDGEFVHTFDSIKEAQETLGITSISSVIQGKSKSAGGFYWTKHNEKLIIPIYEAKCCNTKYKERNKTK